ncbi:putative exo-beta- - protein [Teratosphaeria destructans]|uniref:Exo-beta- - protein n=1 Tax=Teratosphaeria destructans TaxID=418781 RepID=A0A9W7SQX3_9PEZI|nr:putative exo-beta- - protein [Teratosphaeria destructans]
MAPFTSVLSSALTLAIVNCAALPYIHGGPSDKVEGLQHSNGLYANDVPLAASTYQCFDEDSQQSLDPSEWLSFDDLWRVNERTILSSNSGNMYMKHYVHEGILKVAKETGVDKRLILVIMMQKSSGNVNALCASNLRGETRCGLMQVTDGSGFDESNISSSVTNMIREGVLSSDSRPIHDKDWKYLSDVANRLLGWNGRGAGLQPLPRPNTMDFTTLPAELRCIIYSHLIADFVNPHHLKPNIYRPPDDWPKNNFTCYLALIRTCKLVHSEAVPHFEKHFLPGLTLHFDSVTALHTIAKTLPPAPIYQDIKFVLATRCEALGPTASTENAEFEAFREQQTGPESLLQENWTGHRKFQAKHEGRYYCRGCGIRLTVAKQGRAGSLVHSYTYDGREVAQGGGMSVVMRGLWHEEDKVAAKRSWYFELAGRFGGLEWREAEREDGNGVEKASTRTEEDVREGL